MYMVLDLETTGICSHKRVANPLDFDNKIVAIIKKYEGQSASVEYETSDEGISRFVDLELDNVDLLIGMNFKFDLLYLWKNPSLESFLKRGGRIWDIQLAEFLIQGQNPKYKFLSLDKLSEMYGGVLKPIEQKKLLSLPNGLGFRNVPLELRDEYCLGDANNPEMIYLQQLEFIKKAHPNFLKLVELRMDYILATCEAEYNGVKIDLPLVRKLVEEKKFRLEELRELITAQIYKGWSDKLEFSPNSDAHVSAVLFGGTFLKEHVKDEHGVFLRTGKLLKNREKLVAEPIKVNIFGINKNKQRCEKKKAEVYKVDKEVLKSLLNTPAGEFCSYLLEYRKLYKTVYTYLDPILEHVYPDGTSKGEYNHCACTTSRLSSSNPNMQNFDKKLRVIVISRFDGGIYVVGDLSQIEVVGAAYQSQDEVLLWEINSGEDIHLNNACMTLNLSPEEVTDEQRTKAKICTFQLLYGASKDMVGEYFYNSFQEKYKGIAKWHKSLEYDLYEHEQYNRKTKQIETMLVRPTGKRYYFLKYEASEKYKSQGISHKYSLTQLKDYPVQGDAADMMADIAGKIFRYCLPYRQDIKIAAFIHDEVDIDFRNNATKELHLRNIYDIVNTTGDRWFEYFGIKLGVDIKSEIEVSDKSWADCKKIEMN